MSWLHSHCKECGKAISWSWEYCSHSCEGAESYRFRKLVNDSFELERLKLKLNKKPVAKARGKKK